MLYPHRAAGVMASKRSLPTAPAGVTEAALVAEMAAVTPTHAAQLLRALAAQGLLHARAAPAARHCGPPRLFGRRQATAAPHEQVRTDIEAKSQ